MMPFPHSVPVAQQPFGFVSIQCFYYLCHKVFLTMEVMFSSFSKELIQTYSGICNFFYIFFQNEFMPLSAFLSFSILMINAKKESWKPTTFQIYQELWYKMKKYYTREKKNRVHLEERAALCLESWRETATWESGEVMGARRCRQGGVQGHTWMGRRLSSERTEPPVHASGRRGPWPTERQTDQLGESSVKYATEPWI